MSRDTPSALAMLRIKAGLTQEEAAKKAKISQEQLSRLENGRTGISALSVRRLSVVYGVSAGEVHTAWEEARDEDRPKQRYVTKGGDNS